jgi:hypothetical protein
MIQLLILLLALALLMLVLLAARSARSGNRYNLPRRHVPVIHGLLADLGRAFTPRVLAANIGEGTHPDGALAKRADAAITDRHRLVKFGSDANHIALCGAGDLPLGPCPDEPEAAEDPCAVLALGAVRGTVKMVASEAIDAGEQVYTAASGKVQDLPGGAGTYYLVGTAATAAGAADEEIEVIPSYPIKVVIS